MFSYGFTSPHVVFLKKCARQMLWTDTQYEHAGILGEAASSLMKLLIEVAESKFEIALESGEAQSALQ